MTMLTTDALDEVARRCGVPMRLVCVRWSRIISDATLASVIRLVNAAVSTLDRRDINALMGIIDAAVQGWLFQLARWILAMSAELHSDIPVQDELRVIDAIRARPCVDASMLMADMVEAKLWFYPDYMLFMVADDATARRIIAACPSLAALQDRIGARRRDLIRRLVLPARIDDQDNIMYSPDSKEGMALRARTRLDQSALWLNVLTRIVDLDGDYVPLSACGLINITTYYAVYMLSVALYLTYAALR